MEVKLPYDPVCLRRRSVIISLKGGKLHFYAPTGAIVICLFIIV